MAMVSGVIDNKINQPYSPIVLPQSDSATDKQIVETGQEGERPAYIVDISPDAKEKNAKVAQQKKPQADDTNVASAEPWRRGKTKGEQKTVEKEVWKLKQIQQEVIAHEQAHKSTGGQYAGGVSYSKTTGPDGKQYIVGGEVSIDISSESTPQKTIVKMQIVRSAALAPASPSGQDRSVAAAASSLQMQAQSELSKQTSDKMSKTGVVQDKKSVEGKAEQTVIQKEQKQVEAQGKQENKQKEFWMQQFTKQQQTNTKNPKIGTIIDLSA